MSSDAEAPRILEVRNTELLEDAEKLRSALADAKALCERNFRGSNASFEKPNTRARHDGRTCLGVALLNSDTNSGSRRAQLLVVAVRFRNSYVKAAATGLAFSSHPTSGQPQSATNAIDSIIVSRSRQLVLGPQDEPPPMDPSDPQATLEMLRTVDHDHLLDVVNKTGSTVRKWQEQ